MYLRDFFALKLPQLQFMLGLHFTPACVLLLVCSLHFTLSLHFTPGPHSSVCSPQSAFYTDRFPIPLDIRRCYSGRENQAPTTDITEMICTLSLLECAFNLLYFLLKEHLLCYTKGKDNILLYAFISLDH